MALPAPNTNWPPDSELERYQRVATNATWYGGDPNRLANLYGAASPKGTSKREQRILGRIHDWFWGTGDLNEPDDKVHVPVAQDIAAMSAELLFAKAPKFTCRAVEHGADGEPTPAEVVLVKQAQHRLDTIVDRCGLEATLPAAAETAAALGGVGLRIGWEPGMEYPTISRVDADATLGEWQFGVLQAVTFWHVLERTDADVWYHLERHEVGGVMHGLYKGNAHSLGQRMGLAQHAGTVGLVDRVDDDGWMTLIPGYLGAAVVPNMLPDPLHRLGNSGRSDFTPGVLTLFDSIDRTMTSLMRDIEDGRSRLLLADYMLESRSPGQGVQFDQHQHVFHGLRMNPTEAGDPPITSVQFKIRVDEHLRTLDYLINLAVKECGYNTDAELGNAGTPMTATEYEGRAKRSLNTRNKKARYWTAALEPLLQALLAFDNHVVGNPTPVRPVSVILAPPVQASERILAETVELLSRAKASSIKTMVEVLHPDWEPDQVADEVEAVMHEQGIGPLADPNAVPEYSPQG